MKYSKALDTLNALRNNELVVDYRLTDDDLSRMSSLMELLGNPQNKFRSIHVAGTKGKGSTVKMTASILAGAGYRVGMYISPHLLDIRERISINGIMMTKAQFVDAWEKVSYAISEYEKNSKGKKPTFFESLTAIAFIHFAEQNVDFAVLEVGLGGKFDATNIVKPEVTAITTIGRDHVNILGPTLDLIANEKAGIMKPGIPVVIGKQRRDVQDILVSRAKAIDIPCYVIGKDVIADIEKDDIHADFSKEVRVPSPRPRFKVKTWDKVYDGLQLSLFGAHQRDNAATAIAMLEVLKEKSILDFKQEDLRLALKKIVWPGRMEILNLPPAPKTMLDVAHDRCSMHALVQTIKEDFSPQRTVVLFSAMVDKDIPGMLDELSKLSDIIVMTEAPSPRVASSSMTVKLFADNDAMTIFNEPNMSRAYLKAVELAGPDGRLLVTGSFAVVAAVKHIIAEK